MGLYFCERDLKFFQVIRDNRMLINAEDFDNQLNLLEKHLKNIKKIADNILEKPFIQNINESFRNKAIFNVGDGTLDIRKLRYTDLKDKIKLEKLIPNIDTFIIAYPNRFAQIRNYDARGNYLPLSMVNGIIDYRKITASSLGEKLTGKKFQDNSITRDKLGFNPTEYSYVPNQSIVGAQIVGSSINLSVFADDLEYKKIELPVRQLRESNIQKILDNRYDKPINFIGNFTARHFTDKLITKFQSKTQGQYHLNFRQIFSTRHIPDNALTFQEHFKKPLWLNKIIAPNSIELRHFYTPLILMQYVWHNFGDNNLRLVKIEQNGKLGLRHLHPRIRAFLGG